MQLEIFRQNVQKLLGHFEKKLELPIIKFGTNLKLFWDICLFAFRSFTKTVREVALHHYNHFDIRNTHMENVFSNREMRSIGF